jgi:hypothetical protein
MRGVFYRRREEFAPLTGDAPRGTKKKKKKMKKKLREDDDDEAVAMSAGEPLAGAWATANPYQIRTRSFSARHIGWPGFTPNAS